MERDYPIDRGRQTIFGHSLGGLFVLQVLLTRPDMFHLCCRESVNSLEQAFYSGKSGTFVRPAENLQVSVLLAAGEIEKHIKAESRSTQRRCNLYYPGLKMKESVLNTARV